MQLTFCGANREVTGSCYHIRTNQAQVVIDCGMFQGGKYAEDKNQQPFPFDPREIDAVVLTHAHFDHTGRLPKLYHNGFRGKIYCTTPTADLSMITLRDSVHLLEDEAERHQHEPLFTEADVEPLGQLFKTIGYHQEVQVAPGVRVYLVDVGHILGSASIRLNAEGQTVVFSGDLGNAPAPLLSVAECLTGADAVVIESTYGTRVHEPASERLAFLRDAILQTVRNRGTLLIPAFAIERSQELLYELNHLHNQGEIPNLPVFLDSPMAIAATEVFRQHTEFMEASAQADLLRFGDLFSFPGLTSTATSADSKHILEVKGPKIIIAGSGMMNGGRILHHLKNYLGMRNTILLIIGFQVEGSLGRRLHEGERQVRIFGQDIQVHAQVRSCGAFSGHADYPRLTEWLHCFAQNPPKNVFVTHGEEQTALTFAGSTREHLGFNTSVPHLGDTVTL